MNQYVLLSVYHIPSILYSSVSPKQILFLYGITNNFITFINYFSVGIVNYVFIVIFDRCISFQRIGIKICEILTICWTVIRR